MRARVVQRGVVPCGRCSLVVPSWCHGLCELRAGLWLWCAGRVEGHMNLIGQILILRAPQTTDAPLMDACGSRAHPELSFSPT